jgi:hypothetical protein
MTTDIWTSSFIRNLSEEQINEFQEIVLMDVKNKIDDKNLKDILLSNTDLWLYSLQILRREIELQLAQHKTNIRIKLLDMVKNNETADKIEEVKLIENKWRNNAMKFLTSIEKKTLYVKLLLSEEEED